MAVGIGIGIGVQSPLAGGVAAWAPSDLASVVDWATGDDVTTDGEGVNKWAGREGDVILTQPTGARKPGFSDPALTFDGGDDLSSALSGGQFTSSPLAQPFTWGIRLNWGAAPSATHVAAYGTGASNLGLQLYNAASGPDVVAWGPSTVAHPHTPTAGYHSYVMVIDGASSSLREDGSEKDTASQTGSATGMVLGATFVPSAYFLNLGEMRGWALFSSALAGDDLSDLETWLAAL